MSHYYDFDASLQSKPKQLKAYIGGKTLTFISDIGVFSKDEIDFGSHVFIKELLKLKPVESILDVGCGYGVIGLTLSYFDACARVHLVDINERALDLTKQNSKNLSIKNAIIYKSDGLSEVVDTFDRIVINPPIRAGKAVIYKMFEDSLKHLNDNGELWIVIKKDLGAPSACKKITEIFNNCECVLKHKGYWILKAIKKLDTAKSSD